MKLTDKDRFGLKILGVLMLLIISFLVLGYKLSQKTPIDEKTLCPIASVVSGQKVVVIDKSEKWDDDDIKRLKGLLQGIYRDVQLQERLTITAITGQGGQSTDIKTLFDMCNPGDGSKEQCNGLIENCKRLKKRYDASFGEPLQRLSEILSEPGQASYSPLFETITQVIYDNKSEHLEIHFISDLMENSQSFQFDRVIPLADELIKEFPIKTKAKVAVHVDFINRTRHENVIKEGAKSAWHDYFAQQGITSDSTVLLNTNK